MKSKIVISKGDTYYIKRRGIPKGCKYCLQGAKAVLFLNGICQKPDHCSWYCPISVEKRGKDITFVDEIEITSKKELLEEIDKINAKGISITGGEPLIKSNLDKTYDYIKYIREIKGNRFHIHLYTNGINFNEVIANKLAKYGLNEIRFHPSKNNWEIIKKALNKGMSVGAEVPIIPNNEYVKNLEKFIIYLDTIGAEFINLNEFEFCFPNSQSLKEHGFQLKEGTLAVVKDSKEMALDLINKLANKVSIKIHFCTIRAKDYHQLKNRYVRRAKNIRLPYEEINDDGLLLYGQIEGKQQFLDKLYEFLINVLKVPKKLISLEGRIIKLPYYIAIEDEIIRFLDEYNLHGYILEVLPFRQNKYREITEKTPVKIFREEVGYEN
ncbi:MAG: radical SAM protein [Promethearchaeota archaeon]|nr:MAG: radical SAM protein [Candidatus Lokiarchaeota archaeon]